MPLPDAHALAGADGQEGVHRPHAEVERRPDAAAGMGRRRIGPEGADRGPLRQRPLAVDRTPERVDDAAEPAARRPHADDLVAHMRRAAAAHARKGAERHRQRTLPGEPDDLARDHAAAAGLDLDPPADMHRRDRPGDLDEEPAHGGDAAVDLEWRQRFDGPFHGGKAAFAFLRHRLPHQPFVYASR